MTRGPEADNQAMRMRSAGKPTPHPRAESPRSYTDQTPLYGECENPDCPRHARTTCASCGGEYCLRHARHRDHDASADTP